MARQGGFEYNGLITTIDYDNRRGKIAATLNIGVPPMQLTIPATTIKLILLTAALWSALSVIAVVALCSISGS
jgi:hypothetical protein